MAKQIVLKQTLTKDEFKKIFGFKQDRTVNSFIKRVNVNVSIENEEGLLSVDAILKHLSIKKLPGRFLDVKDVAKLLETSIDQVKKLVETKFLPHYRYGESKGMRVLFIKKEVMKVKKDLTEKDVEIFYSSQYGTTRFKLKEYDDIFRTILDFLKRHSLLLSRRECDIFEQMWFENQTPEDLGKEFGVTTSQIHQIFKKAKKRLVLFPQIIEKYYDERNRLWSESKMSAVREKGYINHIAFLENELKKYVSGIKHVEEILPSDVPVIYIEDLGLSARAFNCLKNNSEIVTLDDLRNQSPKQLFRIRNLGKKIFAELTNLLHTRGLDWKKE